MKLKFAPFCSSRDALSDDFSGSPKNVLRKVCHLNGYEKRNLMALVSVAWHLRMWSYEHLKFFNFARQNQFLAKTSF